MGRKQARIAFNFLDAIVINDNYFGCRGVTNDFFKSKSEVFKDSSLVNILALSN